MKLLVKLGGTLLDNDDSRRGLAREIAALVGNGHQIVVVHGGGKQLTGHLANRNIKSHFIRGLRVTTPETLDAVLHILAGQVNTHLVAALVQAGAQAVGLTGADAGLALAVQMSPELGAVGRIEHAQPELLDLLTTHGYLPVVACLAGDFQGHLYNVNADQMAVACAAAFRTERLIFLTDVEGVLDAERRLLPELTDLAALDLIERGVAVGGMEAKLRASVTALRQGVPAVQIAPGARPGALAEILASRPVGTIIKCTKT